MNQPPPQAEISPRSVLGLRLAAIFLLLFGGVMAYQSTQIREGGGFTVIGPRYFPIAVTVGLLVLGVIFLLRTTLWPDRELMAQATAEDRITHWPSVGLTALSLLAYALAFPILGYIVATTLFLPIEARILGSRSPVRDLVVGLGVAVTVYFGFTGFLGVRLPAGLLDSIL
jgi:putative tricarboxylic transport membrane protein